MPSIATGVPAAVRGEEAGSTCTTSGAVELEGVGKELGVIGSTRESAGSFWLAKICVYCPAEVSASPIIAVWLPVVVQLPRMLSRWPQHALLSGVVQSRLVPP